jgi:hypothetical protein
MPLAFRRSWLVPALFAAMTVSAAAQSHPNFEGMWGDPPVTAEDTFCAAFCTDAGLERLAALLDDPANDARPYAQLSAQAFNFQRDSYVRPRLTPAALRRFPLDPATDPGLVRCEPWGLARQVFARHQLEIRQRGADRLDMRYGEWDARRTVHLTSGPQPANQPPTPMGYSVAHYEGDTLVIESSSIAPNWLAMGGLYIAEHSDRLRIVERYTRSTDGKRLLLTATLEDPTILREPLVLKRVWSWSPSSKIAPYKDCQRPRDLAKGETRR